MTTPVLNNILKWDGTHLGSYSHVITKRWRINKENSQYYEIILPQGIIYTIAVPSKDALPCIVEDIKKLFGLVPRGVHRITIDRKEYMLYYVPISVDGGIVWETPLNCLDPRHVLRSDPNFRLEVQKLISFCELLALSGTGEPAIRTRIGVDGYLPVNTNESTTILTKNADSFSILSKTIFNKWFGEETSMSDVVKHMVHYNGRNLTQLTSEMRSAIETIVKKYDSSYVWYGYFIVDRLSRHLLNS